MVAWLKGTARKGFLVQRAADAANPATFAAPIPWTKTKFKFEREKSSSILNVRVAAIDTTSPTGIGLWSDWVACTVG